MLNFGFFQQQRNNAPQGTFSSERAPSFSMFQQPKAIKQAFNQFTNNSRANVFSSSLPLSRAAADQSNAHSYAPSYAPTQRKPVQSITYRSQPSFGRQMGFSRCSQTPPAAHDQTPPENCQPTPVPTPPPPAQDQTPPENCQPTPVPTPPPPAQDQTPPENCQPTPVPTPPPPAQDQTPPENCQPTPVPTPPPPAQDQTPPENCQPTPVPTPPPPAVCSPAPVPPPPPAYDGGCDGSYWGDPHLVGFDGEKYDVMGQAGKSYNMLSDKNLQYNTTFADFNTGNGATVIGAAGIQVGSSKVALDAKAKSATVDGVAMTSGQKVTLDKGGSALWDGSSLAVTSSEYNINLTVKKDPNGTDYLDSSVKINGNPFGDGVKPHGLLGQTADGVAGAKDTGVDLGKQGGTVIDGTVSDYEVSGLFDTTSSKYDRFSA